MSLPKYYNRIGYVVLREGNEVYDIFRGLNFKFSCEFCKSPGEGVTAQASVGILGLNGDTIFNWASFCNSTNTTRYNRLMGSKARSVSVYAGYESGFTGSPLFTLPVVGAWITNPPEMWLNISAYNTKEFNSHVYTITMNPPLDDPDATFSAKEVCQKIADTIGAKLTFEANKESVLWRYREVNITGTVSKILQWINHDPWLYAYINIGEPDAEIPELVVFQQANIGDTDNLKEADMKGGQSNVYTISAETGMIGIPKLQIGNNRASQIEVTTLLRQNIDPGDTFKVKSDYLKFANDTFVANKIKHEGEFRGNTWQTTITGRDPNTKEKKENGK